MRSTHRGHCQACGRLQMLPGGRLAKHGYTVAHGFFAGTCTGSAHLPFEQSCALVETFIANAQRELTSLEAYQTKLRAPATDATCVVRVYSKESRQYFWTRVEIRSETKQYSDFEVTRYFHGDAPLANRGNDLGDSFKYASALDVASDLNAIYAAWLDHEADSLRRYIAWQQERVATWKPADVLPIDAKDKAGFTPTAPRYDARDDVRKERS